MAAETVTIARPYAEALFDLAREQGARGEQGAQSALTQWSDCLMALARLADDTRVRAVVGDPNVPQEQLVELFAAVAPAGEMLTRFLQLLARNRRLLCLPAIAALYETYRRAAEGVREGVLVSAFPLSEVQVRELTPTLEAHFKSKLKLSVQLDPALIGGMVVMVGDQVLDVSVRGRLAAMAVALKN